MEETLKLVKGNQITQNQVNRAQAIVKKYYDQKGFNNADVKINLQDDLSAPNEVIVNIIVDRHDKIKVHKIYIEGNEVLSDRAIKRTMKKTNEKNDILKIFSQKKFVPSDYKDDLARIISKYNEKGYRDAKIVADSVVNYNDKTVDVFINVDEGKKYYIKDINWVGNTIYSTELLNDVLGMKSRSGVYNQKMLDKRLNDDEDAVANIYYNQGYLFYELIPIEKEVSGDSISLEMRMHEGTQATS